MKQKLRILLIGTFLVLASQILLSQGPPHPNNGNAPNSGNTPVGGGAPIAGGVYILQALALAYGISRLYVVRKQKTEQQ